MIVAHYGLQVLATEYHILLANTDKISICDTKLADYLKLQYRPLKHHRSVTEN
jgi:hypothetical protein